MTRRLFNSTIEEWQGSFPKEGEFHFILSANINKKGNSSNIKKITREYMISCLANEDNGFSRTVTVKIITSNLELYLVSSLAITLLNKLFSLYHNSSLKVKFDGTIIGIKNYLQIQRSWKTLREGILENHKGTNIRKFIRSVDSRFGTEKKMIADISSYENFGLLFHSIYGKHNSLSPISKEFQFIGIKKVFSIEENIKLSELDDSKAVITAESDAKLSSDIVYSGRYEINKINLWIEKAVINIKEHYNDVEYLSEFHLQQKV